jgi:4-aminobutyrate aminotransferase-like enzyme/Ser/Thr protein kinase RdoA (MazF antagonist)
MSLVGTLSENPGLSAADAAAILRSAWGIDGAALSDLGSLQDQNLRVTRADGTCFVLKVTWLGPDTSDLDLQNAAMRHVAAHRRGFDSPVPVRTLAGADIALWHGHAVRLLTWVDGSLLADCRQLSPADLTALGELSGQATCALAGFAHPAADRELMWDVRQSRSVADDLIGRVSHAGHRRLIQAAMAGFDEVASGSAELPVQVVHTDVTEVNAVGRPGPAGRCTPTGILDFGDTVRSWRVADIVGTLASAAGHGDVAGTPDTDDTLAAAVAVVAGYQAACPLTAAEIAAVWRLTLARAAVNLAAVAVQQELNPASQYASDEVGAAERSVARLLAIPAVLAEAAVRDAAGRGPESAAGPAAGLAGLRPVPMVAGLAADAAVLDLSVTSESFAYGEWRRPDAVAGLAAASGAEMAIARWAESRLTDAGEPALAPPASLHLGVDVFAAAGTRARAPADGSIYSLDAGEIIIDLSPAGVAAWLRVAGLTPADGLAPGAAMSAGAELGTVAARPAPAPPCLHVQLMAAPDLPALVTPRHRAAWLAVSPDPSPLLGIAAAAPPPADPGLLRSEREAHAARSQHLYYNQPPEIVRGWRHHLFGADGRPYLDMVNNIASVGHSHPRIAAAAGRQFGRLNTNSRFLYDSMTRYCARIAALLPGLDSVFLVNSGSEAADLALQLARVATGRRDIIALAGAYHGWTAAVIEVSTSPMDRPHWREELGPEIHIVEQPDPYRGRLGGDAAAYCASVREASAAAATAGGVAAFISEPLLGNQGGVEPPAGYLRGAYDIVRQAGGLCVADEVQVGMARTGATFWAFEHEGVVPDIVFTAKSAGNGHPLGAVACRPEIADAFDGRTAYFSSTGGGPVSCEVGLAVLDILREESLQDNARDVGGYLKSGLLSLAGRHDLIGAVHGRGLYLGVDLVRDRATKEPATDEAMLVSEALRPLGVIMQPTGDAFNVLKVKPPLCIDRDAADFFVSALDRALQPHS